MYNYWKINGYPFFSEEKQFKLLKLISLNMPLIIQPIESVTSKKLYEIRTNGIGSFYHEDFKWALAQITTQLIKLEEIDREEVRKILEQ